MELNLFCLCTRNTLFLVCILLQGCRLPHSHETTRAQPLLGTFVAITVDGSNPQVLQGISKAFKEIQRIDSLLSLHREDSELVQLNRSAAKTPLPVSCELFSVLEKAQEISQRTDGSFD